MKKEICLNKKYAAGIDIGNSSTEIALAEINPATGEVSSFSSGLSETTGIKGTYDNVAGIKIALQCLLEKRHLSKEQIALIRINEAAPVIGDFAMETITETVITESTMIGHNPDTPGGKGLGVGKTILFSALDSGARAEQPYIVIVPEENDFRKVAAVLNQKMKEGIAIKGAILQNDDGVLVCNRLDQIIPIVDEVKLINKIPVGVLCAIEVVRPGQSIKTLSNPYGIASVFHLNSQETGAISVIAKALIGTRSAVVLKTPKGKVKERRIPAGTITIESINKKRKVSIHDGAERIMEAIEKSQMITDIDGEKGTAFGGMIAQVKNRLAGLIKIEPGEVKINDLLAADTVVPQKVTGGLAGEHSGESAVAIAVMVRTKTSFMKELAKDFSRELQIPVEVAGVEADMAALGALTTPGAGTPLVVVDIGAGSTDACSYDKDGKSISIHLAGAGNMVTMLINSELSLNNLEMAENIKKYPLAKVESFYSIRHEDNVVEFFDKTLASELYGKTIVTADQGFLPVDTKATMEEIRKTRREAKEKVLVQNIIRGLKGISPTGSLTAFKHVVMVGGSALDFELSNMVTQVLEKYGVTAGQANILGTEGPRNAVATGLLLSIKP